MTTSNNSATGSHALPVAISLPQISTHQTINSQKRCLQNLSQLLINGIENVEAIDPEFSELDIFDALFEREKLGSTAIGHGCALPHGRIEGLTKPQFATLTLAEPLDFDAPDGEPVDVILGLIVPSASASDTASKAAEQHLQLLATLASFLENEDNRTFLRHETVASKVQAYLETSLTQAWEQAT